MIVPKKTYKNSSLTREVQRAAEEIWSRIPENHYLGWTADEVSPQSLKPWKE